MPNGAHGARHCVRRKSPRSTLMSDAANRAGTGQLIGVRMQPDELAAIDSYRRDLPRVPSRPEAMRRLCVQALDPRADNSAAPAPRPLREIVRDFFDADPSRVGISFAAATKTRRPPKRSKSAFLQRTTRASRSCNARRATCSKHTGASPRRAIRPRGNYARECAQFSTTRPSPTRTNI